jgi:hypothetical protein
MGWVLVEVELRWLRTRQLRPSLGPRHRRRGGGTPAHQGRVLLGRRRRRGRSFRRPRADRLGAASRADVLWEQPPGSWAAAGVQRPLAGGLGAASRAGEERWEQPLGRWRAWVQPPEPACSGSSHSAADGGHGGLSGCTPWLWRRRLEVRRSSLVQDVWPGGGGPPKQPLVIASPQGRFGGGTRLGVRSSSLAQDVWPGGGGPPKQPLRFR